MAQVVHRIIGGADDFDLKSFQDTLRGQRRRGQPGVRFFPDPRGGGFVQQFVDAEVALQLEMGPMVERIAQCLWHGGGPSLELGERIGAAGAEFLGHTV